MRAGTETFSGVTIDALLTRRRPRGRRDVTPNRRVSVRTA